MSLFGANPIDPRSAQPATRPAQRVRDTAERRVASAESDSAVRRTADEHADEDSKSKRERRDGKRDEFQHVAPDEVAPENDVEAELPAPPSKAKPKIPPSHFDFRA